MSKSFLSLNYHFVFSTRGRVASIHDGVINDLHAYLGGTIKGLGGHPLSIGGAADHVHLLVRLRSDHRVSDVLRDLKKASSTWMSDEKRVRDFSWQDGYGGFTVGRYEIDRLFHYIANQEEHHRRVSSIDEFKTILEEHGVEFDDRYLL